MKPKGKAKLALLLLSAVMLAACSAQVDTSDAIGALNTGCEKLTQSADSVQLSMQVQVSQQSAGGGKVNTTDDCITFYLENAGNPVWYEQYSRDSIGNSVKTKQLLKDGKEYICSQQTNPPVNQGWTVVPPEYMALPNLVRRYLALKEDVYVPEDYKNVTKKNGMWTAECTDAKLESMRTDAIQSAKDSYAAMIKQMEESGTTADILNQAVLQMTLGVTQIESIQYQSATLSFRLDDTGCVSQIITSKTFTCTEYQYDASGTLQEVGPSESTSTTAFSVDAVNSEGIKAAYDKAAAEIT